MSKLDNLSKLTKCLKENLPLEGNQNTVLTAKTCKRFDGCSAPICPLYEFGGIWYPDEEVCKLAEFNCELWLKQQKKIAKKARNKDFYFVYEMLNHNYVVTVATEGIDPDKECSDNEGMVNKWLKKHPGKKAKTKDQLDLLRIQLAGFRKAKTTEKKDQSAEEISKKDANPLGVLEPSLPQQYQSAT